MLSDEPDPTNLLVSRIPYVVSGTPFAHTNSPCEPPPKSLYFNWPVG